MSTENKRSNSMLGALLSASLWVASTVITFAWVIVGLIVLIMPGDKNRARMHRVAAMWGRSLVAIHPLWKVEVEGQENIDPNKHYVVIANHQSLIDILAALCAVPIHFKFLAKKELFPIPGIGWHMTLAGYIPLDRKSAESGKQAILKAASYLDQSVSVLFFPEGTRSVDGKMQPFKMGAFKLAREHKAELLPVVIDGTQAAVPKHSARLDSRAVFKVSIGKPVSPEGVHSEALVSMRDSVHAEMSERLEKMRSASA